jgi:DUF1680 family protein
MTDTRTISQLEAEGYPWIGCECCKGTLIRINMRFGDQTYSIQTIIDLNIFQTNNGPLAGR